MYKYLFILEDGHLVRTNEISIIDAENAKRGDITIIDMDSGEVLNSLGKWEEIDTYTY